MDKLSRGRDINHHAKDYLFSCEWALALVQTTEVKRRKAALEQGNQEDTSLIVRKKARLRENKLNKRRRREPREIFLDRQDGFFIHPFVRCLKSELFLFEIPPT